MTTDNSSPDKIPSRCALYARVSSELQDIELSISAQLNELREYAQKRGWQIVREYVDEAYSGRTGDRPAFQRMIEESKQKQPPFGVILVHKLDRLARSVYHYATFKHLLEKQGIMLIAIKEDLGETAVAEMVKYILGAVNEFYSKNLAIEVKKGHSEIAKPMFLVLENLRRC